MGEPSQPNSNGKKHQWSQLEDKALVECLLELAACKKWTGDNGTFKAGYTKVLEKWIHLKMPGCGLMASPHIESRVKHLKKQYGAIAEMLKASGFGWNDEKKMIVVEKSIFDDWVKSHSNAKGLYNKSFPHYDDLALVYGKDRANGEDAEDPFDSVEAMDRERVEEDYVTMDEEIHIEETPIYSAAETQTQSPGQSYAHNGQNSATTSRGKRKRSIGTDVVIDQLVETMKELGKVYGATNDNIGDLVGCFKHEKETADRRMQVFQELKKLEGLTNIQRVRAGALITNNPSAVDFFFTIDDPELKTLYVSDLLATRT